MRQYIALIHKDQSDADAAGEALKTASAVLARSSEPDDLSAALIDALPAAQVVLTTAGVLPDGAAPDRVIHLERETV